MAGKAQPDQPAVREGVIGAACHSGVRDSGAPVSASPESITTTFAWGDMQPIMFNVGSGGYGFRACAKRRIPERQ
jgi:hypothetical protein